MSNTRTAKPGSEFRQEKYASSVEFHRGLMANLVAPRCKLLPRREDRELVWFLQLLSHREGGLEQVARELVAQFPEALATQSMRKFGAAPGQVYTPDQVKAVRAEIPNGEDTFLLTGEMTGIEMVTLPTIQTPLEEVSGRAAARDWWAHTEAIERAENRPNQYPVAVFQAACLDAASSLGDYLAELCLNPALKFDNAGTWYLPTLIETLRKFQADWVSRRRGEVIFTEIGKQVSETIEYSLESRCLTVIDGLARTGKTHSAKAWCELNPGRARYVQVPSNNDDIGFFREIAKSLGVSINLNSKAQELRQRIEDAVGAGDLVLVFDEAHYLWPNGNYRLALPNRLNWIMTALVNAQVPVCLITTPQFFRSQKAVEQRTHWTSEQFIGRIGHYQKLPDSLNEPDLFAVARAVLPEGDSNSIEMLVRYAQGSAKYLAAIDTAARRAKFLAKRDGRQEVQRGDVKRAITESVIPSDSALAQALTPPSKSKRQTGAAVPVPLAAPAAPVRETAPAGGGAARQGMPSELETNRLFPKEVVTA